MFLLLSVFRSVKAPKRRLKKRGDGDDDNDDGDDDGDVGDVEGGDDEIKGNATTSKFSIIMRNVVWRHQ